MVWVERIFFILCQLAGLAGFLYIVWTRRLRHVWPKRRDLRIVNPAGFLIGLSEVLFQWRVLRNRPIVGFLHVVVFYGFLAFGAKSFLHVLVGFGVHVPVPAGYTLVLDVFAAGVLAALAGLAVRRYLIDRPKLTHMAESAAVLSLIALLMITHLLEHAVSLASVAGRINWWVHFLVLCGFPALIAYGKHLHLLMAPVNVILRHVTERPQDRRVFGNDFNLEDEEKMEAEYARLGMPGGVRDFSFHALFDGAACIECGRCNDACPSGPTLKPRDHFVLALRDPTLDAQGLAALVDPTVLATCVQCRACDTVCPTGCRPARNALEMRGRLAFEGLYPPRPLKDGGLKPTVATGNIFGLPESERSHFIRTNGFPIYDPSAHEVLFVLGCQGANSPEVQPVVLATARLLDAAGVKWGVLAEEKCWGEALLHAGGLLEDWPLWARERIESLTQALGGDRGRTILTICPHCRDTIGVQYASLGAKFTGVRLHTPYLAELVRSGRLQIEARPLEAAIHTPCKVVHNDEDATMEDLLRQAGVTLHHPPTMGFPTSCCGGGGGGFLWDSPAKVNKRRWEQIRETGQKRIVTGCPGCHRMLGILRDEETSIVDVSTVLLERVRRPGA